MSSAPSCTLSRAVVCVLFREHNIPPYAERTPPLVPCHVFHPMCPHSCTQHALIRWLKGFRASFLVYVPVHVIPLLLFHWRDLVKKCVLPVAAVPPLTSRRVCCGACGCCPSGRCPCLCLR